MKIVTLKCPECEAVLEIDKEKDFCFCQYCGAKIILDDEKKRSLSTRI